MKRLAVLAVALSALACNRERTYAPPAPAAPAEQSGTWVANPAELTPEQIRLVQRALGDRGFAVEPSGAYDGATKVALGDFQRSRGLAETGNLNADTAAALGIDPAEVMPVREGAAAAAAPAAEDPGATPPAAEGAATAPSTVAHPEVEEDASPRVEPRY